MIFGKKPQIKKTILALLAVVFLLPFFVVGAGIDKAIGAEIIPNNNTQWTGEKTAGIDGNSHIFKFDDDGGSRRLIHNFKIDGTEYQVIYENGEEIKFWDFVNPVYRVTDIHFKSSEFRVLASQSYSIYRLPGLNNTYLIINNTAGKILGTYMALPADGKEAYCTFDDKSIECPWKYYKLDTQTTGFLVDINDQIFYREPKDGDINQPQSARALYDLKAFFGSSSLRAKYIGSVNSREFSIDGSGCREGIEYSHEQLKDCFFPIQGRFYGESGSTSHVKIERKDSDSPSITIKGSNFFPTDGSPIGEMYFELARVDAARGGYSDTNYFYFVAKKPSYPNLAIRIPVKSCDSKSTITGSFYAIGTDTFTGDNVIPTKPSVTIDNESFFKNLINRVYNDTDGSALPDNNRTCPDVKYINVSSGGQLDKWSTDIDRSERETPFNTKDGDIVYNGETCTGGSFSGIKGFLNIIDRPAGIICVVSGWILSAEKSIYEKFNGMLKDLLVIDFRNNFAKGGEGLEGDEEMDRLSLPSFVTEVWKGIRDIFNMLVILAILVTAFATVFKVDVPGLDLKSWQFQRMLPTIVASIFLVNFSLSIANLVILISNGLVDFFLGGISDPSSAMNSSFLSVEDKSIFAAILAVILGAIFIILYVYLYIMLWIRGIVILALLAFAALPYIGNIMPIDTVKKLTGSWWSQFTSWVFMGPVAAVLLWMASIASSALVGEPKTPISGEIKSDINLTSLAVTSFLIYLAATQPLKMGGAIMSSFQGYLSGKKGPGKHVRGYAKKEYERVKGNVKTSISAGIKERAAKAEEARAAGGNVGLVGGAARKAMLVQAKRKKKDEDVRARLSASEKELEKQFEEGGSIEKREYQASELTERNDKVKEIAERNVNRDVASIRKDYAKEMEKISQGKGDKQKAAGLAKAIKDISNGYGAGSNQAKMDEAKKEMKEITDQLGVNFDSGTNIDAAFINNMTTNAGLRSAQLNQLKRSKFQGDAAGLESDFANPPTGVFDPKEALSNMTDDDIERAQNIITSAPPPPVGTPAAAARAAAIRNIATVRSARIANLTSGQDAMLQESINNPAFAPGSAGLLSRQRVYDHEESRLKKIKGLIDSGDIEAARSLMETTFRKDMKGVTEAQMKMMYEARNNAFTGLGGRPGSPGNP